MQHATTNKTDVGSLRFIFDDAVFNCSLPDHPTFGDVAASLARFCDTGEHHPLSIAVTLAKSNVPTEHRS